jgi:hypothetical protein
MNNTKFADANQARWCRNMYQLPPDMNYVLLYFNYCILLVSKNMACKEMHGLKNTRFSETFVPSAPF